MKNLLAMTFAATVFFDAGLALAGGLVVEECTAEVVAVDGPMDKV